MKGLIKKRNLIIIGVVIIAVAGMAYASFQSGMVEVTYEAVAKGQVIKTIEEDASVRSRLERTVSPLVSGQIDSIHVEPGDKVQVGDPLVTIVSETTELRLRAAKEQLAALQFAMDEALKPADRNKVRTAEASKNAAYASYKTTDDQLKNDKALYEAGAISQSVYDASVQSRKVALETYNMRVSQLNDVRSSLSDELKNKFVSEIEAQEAVVEELEVMVSYHQIAATTAGVVTEKFMNAGDFVTMGAPVLELSKTDNLYLESLVLDSDVRDFKEGMTVFITIRDDMEPAMGMVSKIHPKAYTKISDLGIEQKRVLVEITSDQLDQVRLGEELDVAFVIGQAMDVPRVAEELTYRVGDQVYVFVEKEGQVFDQPVEIGLEGESYMEILGGIKVGDQLIVPTDEIEPGTRIKK